MGATLLFFLLARASVAKAPEKQNEEYVMREDPQVTQALYEEWSKKILKRSNQPSRWYCSCVIFAKQRTGFTESIGFAKRWPKNSKIPIVGGVVITRESWAGHVAIITAVRETEIDVIEANYSRCRITTRTININNSLILGYWKE